MSQCDVYLFCLWKKAENYWKYIIDDIKKNYDVQMCFECEFPNRMQSVRKFYGNVPLEGGYPKKLRDIAGRFVFCIAKDSQMNDIKKLKNLKKKYRNIGETKDDYSSVHASVDMKEFVEEIQVLENLPWKSATYT